MPGTSATCWPAKGESRVAPWMSWIRVTAAEAVCGTASSPPVSAAATSAVSVTGLRRARRRG
ncbi:hypothetical protein [Streptomyces sp. Ac-502]|uniref:hypothetical protein n=1 Tax=Streptomyces sp. Ac-502 TaxID=3342801 RepID=UPI0038624B3C